MSFFAEAAQESTETPMFGPYRLERELGRGCSSIVYAARDSRRPRLVALKVLTVPAALDAERQRDLEERFRREAQAVSTLAHPNIVSIYEAGQAEGGRQFIAMALLPGETLRRRLDQAAPLSVPLTVALGVQVAEALHYAHGRGIIHRDVKPDNIFLAQDGTATATPKLMDFGIAHVLSDQALTQEGALVGSPAYMAPEQIHGLPPDARTDVFALAVTLAEMATGVKPFAAQTIPALMQKILHQAPDLRGVADRPLRRVLAKALAKNPGARYADAGAFAQALRRAAPFAVPALRLASAARPAGPRRLSRLGAAGLGGLALASLVALPFLTGHPPHASAQMVAETPADARPAPVRQAARRAKRHRPAPVRAAAALARPGNAAASKAEAVVVRIVEGKPNAPLFSLPFRPARSARPARAARAYPPPFSRPARAPRLTLSALVRPAPRPDGPPRPLSQPLPRSADDLDHTDAAARVRLSISEAGDVTEAYILHSAGSRALDDAALDAVGHWEYAPAVQDGRPVPGTALETVRFAAADSRPEPGPSRMAFPVPLSRPLPRPADGLDHTDAAVRVRLSVSEAGDVTEAYILRSSGSRALDDAALDAVGHWTYAPAVQNGRPVPGTALETVKFLPW